LPVQTDLNVGNWSAWGKLDCHKIFPAHINLWLFSFSCSQNIHKHSLLSWHFSGQKILL
jgi:hypothetical protein